MISDRSAEASRATGFRRRECEALAERLPAPGFGAPFGLFLGRGYENHGTVGLIRPVPANPRNPMRSPGFTVNLERSSGHFAQI